MVILHQHQSSQDSSDSGSLPPTYSRLPPDGHEFPEGQFSTLKPYKILIFNLFLHSVCVSDYVDPSVGFQAQQEQEYLSRKSSASSTASLDRHELRLTLAGRKFAGLEDKVSGVRAKIAMFSNSNGKGGSAGGKMGKFQSSEDVGKLSVSGSLTRAHTHGDVRFDEGKRQSLHSPSSLKSLTTPTRPESAGPGIKNKFGNLSKGSKAPTAFRSMINVSSTTAEPASPLTPEATVSVSDLSCKESSSTTSGPEKAGRAPAITNRSQSLNEIGANLPDKQQHNNISVTGRSRSSALVTEQQQQQNNINTANSSRKSSMTSLIEQRRRSTMSKLKGLVIPEVTEGSTAGGGGERNSLTARHKSNSSSSKSTTSSSIGGGSSGSSLPSPPWKEKESGQQPAEFPKYSPAFKRKPFTVYNTKKSPVEKTNSSEEKEENSPHYKPPIGKRNSDDSLGSCPAQKTEDSDNDSAVSSGLSSLSGRSSSPPQSPKQREKHSGTNNRGHENPRVLKKNSVEAINRQNVLNACKKSAPTSVGMRPDQERSGSGMRTENGSGMRTENGSGMRTEDLRKAERDDPPLDTSSPRSNRTCGRPASRSSSFTIQVCTCPKQTKYC